CARVYYAMDYW
nr:immunoglobulin heavy chain junction region [Mus musculus]MBK4197869.1 immunoglobulin heavy chain junction region [Mus musculus]